MLLLYHFYTLFVNSLYNFLLAAKSFYKTRVRDEQAAFRFPLNPLFRPLFHLIKYPDRLGKSITPKLIIAWKNHEPGGV